ncbi:hypothetical protein GGI22_007119, partial [Coemansia erecta]
MGLSRYIHIGVDLVLLSATFAGIRRSTGYHLKTESLIENKDMRWYLDKYLSIGESTIDFTARQMEAQPAYFTK